MMFTVGVVLTALAILFGVTGFALWGRAWLETQPGSCLRSPRCSFSVSRFSWNETKGLSREVCTDPVSAAAGASPPRVAGDYRRASRPPTGATGFAANPRRGSCDASAPPST